MESCRLNSIGLIRTDTEGNVSWARDYDIVGSSSELCTKVLATSFGYVVAGRTLGAGFQRAFLLAVSPTGDVLWSRVYGLDGSVHMAPHLYVKNLIALDDGFMFTWAERNGADDDLLLARTDVQGLMACGDVADIEVVTTELPEVTFDPATMASPLSIALDADATSVGPAFLVEECDIALDLGPDTAICGQLTLYAWVPESSQVWLDGSTADSLVVTNAGTFWVTVTMDCCTRTDTIEVAAGVFAGLDLGPDSALCGDGTIVLDVGQPWDETVWSDGTEGSVFVVEEPGTYWVHVSSGACSGSDTIIVGQTNPPLIDIGPDTVICDGDVLALAAQQSGFGCLWSDGSSADSLLVTAPGIYWVEVGSLGCSTIDSVIVYVSPVPVVDLGPDTICCGTVSVTLASGYAGSNTSWSSTPDPIPSILVIVPGTYWVQVSVDGCEASDTVAIGVQQLPLVVFMSDTTLCEPTVLEITPLIAEGGPVTWSDGSGASTLIVDSAGTWSATVENACGSSIDEVTIDMAEWIGLSEHFGTCPGEPVSVELPEGVSEVLWSTGSDQATVYLLEGTYGYQLLDAFGCPRQGQIIVSSDEDGNGLAFVPNVFTPNADGWNDTFKVVGAALDSFELSIFNRWGELIFHSTDPGKEWDGNFKGRAIPDGTYVYLLRYVDRCVDGGMIDRHGHVTLLR